MCTSARVRSCGMDACDNICENPLLTMYACFADLVRRTGAVEEHQRRARQECQVRVCA